MRRLFVLLGLLPLVSVASAAADWPGRPKSDPPRLHQAGPPPAWLETTTRSIWLAYGSYCWRTLCVDMIPPAMRKDVPLVTVKPRTLVRIHLAFTPRTANVLVMGGNRTSTYRLQPGRVLSWHPRGRGVATVDVRGAPGSTGYLFRLRLLT